MMEKSTGGHVHSIYSIPPFVLDEHSPFPIAFQIRKTTRISHASEISRPFQLHQLIIPIVNPSNHVLHLLSTNYLRSILPPRNSNNTPPPIPRHPLPHSNIQYAVTQLDPFSLPVRRTHNRRRRKYQGFPGSETHNPLK